MQLSRMHDIAGCRLIFNNIEQLKEFRKDLHSSPWLKHVLRKKDETPYPYDYMEHPHPDNSGYRGVHDIYHYCARSGRDKSWDGLLVEIQYRTKAQHSWATANEIAGTLTGNYSKFGRGDESQKEFFRLASEIISRTEENMTSCYPNLTDEVLCKKFTQVENEIKLLQSLTHLKMAKEHIDYRQPNIILVYDEEEKSLYMHSFKTFPEAQKAYFTLEKNKGTSTDIVLVRTATEEGLRLAYKNYFSDTQDFTRLIKRGIKQLKNK